MITKIEGSKGTNGNIRAVAGAVVAVLVLIIIAVIVFAVVFKR